MKYIVILFVFFFFSSSAFAFGGGGGDRKATFYQRHEGGVDNFGVHIHPDAPPADVDIFDLSHAPNAVLCQAGIWCCKDGFVLDTTLKKCVPCPKGTFAQQGDEKCRVCSDGTYSDTEAASFCKKVPDGYLANSDKTDIELYCPYQGVICLDRCCPYGTTCGQNNTCCLEDVCAKSDKFFCASTDETGQCKMWQICAFSHSGSSIIGAINATGACGATGGAKLFCKYTDENGICRLWKKCYKTNTGDLILGIPKAEGRCLDFDTQELFCANTNENGDCSRWAVCSPLNSGTSIIGKPNATGVCNPKTEAVCTELGFVWCAGACYEESTVCSE